jgi:hypothetical protein
VVVLIKLKAFILLVFFATPCFAANYTLEITVPQASLNTDSRYYQAYPGIEYEVPIGVFGGVYPFTYELTTYPSGMTIDEDTGVITWSNPTTSGSPHSVTVRVTDDESTQVTRSWTITVQTSNHVVLDGNLSSDCTSSNYSFASRDCSGSSTVDAYNTLADLYEGTAYEDRYDASFNGYHVIIRAGTYDPQGWSASCPGQQCQINWWGNKPVVWYAYPGESVTIDHDSGSTDAYFDCQDGEADDLYMGGIRFQDMTNHAWRTVGDRQVFYDCEFYNLGPGVDGANSSFIMYASTGGTGGSNYCLISNNSFDTLNIGAFIKTYSSNKLVIADNTLDNGSGSPIEGIALKNNDTYVDVRGNFLDNISVKAIDGNWNADSNLEIRFNRVLNASNDYDSSAHGALTINHDDTAGVAYIHRNTFEGTVTLRFATSGDGPFYLDNNVIVNENAAQDTPDGSYITHYDVADSSRIVLGTGDDVNISGEASDNIIDANGDLQGAYTSYLGTKGYQLGETESIPPSMLNLSISSGVR